MENSILIDIKKLIGITEDDTTFDKDMVIYINSAISTLAHIGVESAKDFFITDSSSTWDDLCTNYSVSLIRTYIYIKTKLLFDPPQNSVLVTLMQQQLSELEWRINSIEDEN